ncbi:hypothetical protein [Flavobacterium sp.]|uniref:hypothetical protein n=1 Tax=Flavobacterium sp. TaxID=239 RepID=UPI00248816CD|nr:hypothetical protein [Flavobacterium sp.]MDI1317213.1 hypothetical protein [Flavobacterium sp.]
MKKEDKIFDQFKSAAKNAETKEFAAMDKVWQRVEEKLDTTENKKSILLWKKIAVAACLLLFGTLGYHFLKQEQPKVNGVVVNIDSTKTSIPKKEIIVTSDPIIPEIKVDAAEILQKQLKPERQVALETDIKPENKADAVNEIPSSPSGYFNAPSPSASAIKETSVAESKQADIEMMLQKNRKASLVHKDEPLVVIDNKVEKTKIQDIQFNDDESLVVLNEPLYIINGVEYTEQEVFGPNPTSPYSPLKKQEIETISILQDEKAIEIYGEKGKKGVVIITTKNGKPVASKKAK